MIITARYDNFETPYVDEVQKVTILDLKDLENELMRIMEYFGIKDGETMDFYLEIREL